MEELELRMYFLVPYNISEIQKGIQAGHASLEYARLYGDTQLFKEFVDNHKTWIILNGGTTNNNEETLGSLQQFKAMIDTFNHFTEDVAINYATFYEPDLNDTLTAICLICDQRVWDYKKYPNLVDEEVYDDTNSLDDIAEIKDNWEKMMGGSKNIFLRDLFKGIKLA